MSKPNTGELIFFFILFAVVGLLAFGIMAPYLTAIFLAGILAIVFRPVYHRVHRLCKRSETLAAFLTVGVVLAVILIPLAILSMVLFQEVVGVYEGLQKPDSIIAQLDQAAASVEGGIRTFVPRFEYEINVSAYATRGLAWVAGNLDAFFSGILAFAFDILLVVIAMFFFLRDGDKIHDFTVKWSPLSDRYDESILGKLSSAVTSVVKGALTTAVVQGTLVGIGFAVFGIPNPVLWGTVATVTALIPILGTAIITIPAGVMLLLSGAIGPGVGLIIWALLLVGLIDNFLNPYLLKRGMDIHPLLILLSVFGGLAYFGPIGFLAGPIILAFFFALLDVYPAIIKGREPEQTGA
ncbi:MAG TPA: AI-2E family transporter [Candidatus Paceibacterota bacterium]|nr:AI-2E family transporter [Candidatus Paceibacterota bacterium]